MDIKTLNNFYLSRFIDSMELDKDKWIMQYCAGGDSSWTEYHGPEYTNDRGERLQFAFTLNSIGAYVNGYMSWKIPFLNPFSYRCRRFVAAKRKMIKLCELKEIENYNSKLLNAL